MAFGAALVGCRQQRVMENVRVQSAAIELLQDGDVVKISQVAAMVGLDARSTMDLDATVKGANVSVEDVENMMAEIPERPHF